jgi:DNA-binding transcriptional ArsR family regulator
MTEKEKMMEESLRLLEKWLQETPKEEIERLLAKHSRPAEPGEITIGEFLKRMEQNFKPSE